MATAAAGLKLLTPRCVLRDVTADDAAAFLALQDDPELTRFHPAAATGPEAAAALLARFLGWAAAQPRRNFQLAIEDRADGALLGDVGLRGEGLPEHEAAFGLELARAARGRHGLAREVAHALLAFGFERLGLQAVVAVTVDANRAAGHLAAHLGFVEVAPAAAPDWMRQRGWRERAWRLSREAWRAPAAWP